MKIRIRNRVITVPKHMADTKERKELFHEFMGKVLEAHAELMRERIAAESGLPPLPTDFFMDMLARG